MNRIDKKFKELRRMGKKAFIAFIMAGDPSLAITKKLIFELEKSGADIIELGVPFSDPVADGPVIQHSGERALTKNTNLPQVCNLVRNARLKTQIPIVFLTYYNIIHHFGIERFVNTASKSGVDGVIVADLPMEESDELRKTAKKSGLCVIHLAAPTSSEERLRKIINVSTGFIYYVSLTGTTGIRQTLPEELLLNLKKIKKMTANPVCVGFGISTPEQVRLVSSVCDGVIVGSAIVKVIEENKGKADLVKRVGSFVRKLTQYSSSE